MLQAALRQLEAAFDKRPARDFRKESEQLQGAGRVRQWQVEFSVLFKQAQLEHERRRQEPERSQSRRHY